MIKQLLINGQVNRYTLSNRARQAIAFQYITDTKTLRLIDTYNNVALDLVVDGDNALTSSAMEKVWQYIQNKVDNKVGGAFKFRGNAEADENGYPNISNPKPGDVYQVAVSTGQYNPNTGQLIPSSVQWNDKEFSWAEKVDPNTGLPIGGQWVELGFNFDSGAGMVTKEWVETYMQTKQQAADEHEAISTYINTVSGDLKAYIKITAQDLSAYVDETAQGLSTFVNETAENLSTALVSYIDTVSTNLTYYVNEKVSELSGHIDDLKEYVDNQDQLLSTTIIELNDYVDERMDVISGGFLTRDEHTIAVNNLIAQHQKDLSFILYNDDGEPINYP